MIEQECEVTLFDMDKTDIQRTEKRGLKPPCTSCSVTVSSPDCTMFPSISQRCYTCTWTSTGATRTSKLTLLHLSRWSLCEVLMVCNSDLKKITHISGKLWRKTKQNKKQPVVLGTEIFPFLLSFTCIFQPIYFKSRNYGITKPLLTLTKAPSPDI